MPSQSKIRKVLFNEVSLFLSVASVVIASVLFVVKPNMSVQKDIALMQLRLQEIERNHLTSIEKDIDKMQKNIDVIEDDINSINLKLERILTILKQ